MADLDLVRDVLDEQLLDARGERIGKVDGILLELREEAPPRVLAIEVGLPTLGARLHPRVGGWLARLGRRIGIPGSGVTRLPFRGFEVGDTAVRIDVDASETSLFAWEDWWARHLTGRPRRPVADRRLPEKE